MGIVAKQSVWNSISIIVGVVLGAINTMFLYPLILEPEQFGLTRILVTVGILASQFSLMGMPSILVKFLQKFRIEKGNSYGLLRFVLLSCMVSFGIVGIILLCFKQAILAPYVSNAKSFGDYYKMLFPLVFFITLNGILSNYLKAIFHSIYQLFVNEVVIRVAQSGLLILYFYGCFDFNMFIWLFISFYGLHTVLLVVYLLWIKEFDLRSNKVVKDKSNRKIFYQYGVANLLTGMAYSWSSRIDVLMIGAMVGTYVVGGDEGLKATAIYSMAIYMSAVIETPGRAIGQIATTTIAKAWAKNNISEIRMIYKKSSINQMLIGILIFMGIWMNIDNVVEILNDISKKGYDFSQIKYIVLFLGIGKLINASSGINGNIIITSKQYIFGTYTMIGLLVVTVYSNWIFIPLYGVIGASIATAISMLFLNIVAFLFLYIKFGLQPFDWKSLLLILISGLVYFTLSLIEVDINPIMNIIVKSIIIISVYIPLVVVFRISPDINSLLLMMARKLNIRK